MTFRFLVYQGVTKTTSDFVFNTFLCDILCLYLDNITNKKLEALTPSFIKVEQMHHKRIEQMSSQIYNKISYNVTNFVGYNQDFTVYFNVIRHLSGNGIKLLMYLIAMSSTRMTSPIKKNDLCKQTIYKIDWNTVGPSFSDRTKQYVIKEYADFNILRKLSKDTYVISIDFISAFTIPQRRKYRKILEQYKVEVESQELQPYKDLQGSPSTLIHKS